MSTRAAAQKSFLRLGLSAEKANEILGLLLGMAAVLFLGALVSYHPNDPSWLHRASSAGTPGVENFVGPFGANVAALSFALLGLASFLLPAILSFVAWRRFRHAGDEESGARITGLFAILLTLPGLLQLLVHGLRWRGEPVDAGGALGVLLRDLLVGVLHTGGAFVVLFTVLLVATSLAARSTVGEIAGAVRERLGDLWSALVVHWNHWKRRRAERKTQERVAAQAERQRTEARSVRVRPPGSSAHGAGRIAPPSGPGDADAAEAPKLDLPLRVQEKKGEGQFAVRKVVATPADLANRAAREAREAREALDRGPAAPQGGKSPPPLTRPYSTGPAGRLEAPEKEPEPQQEPLGFRPGELDPPERPPVNLLDTSRPRSHADEADLVRKGEKIEQAAEHFGVEGKIAGISPGPVITVFEFQPAPGVKVSKIVNLQDDLALALKADSVRIDRIPGRSTMGMEVPNPKRSVIHLGQLLADERFRKAKSPLTMALGVDIHGEPVYQDLATMPHLLVAGATGAGKSVGLQSMITSILYRSTKEEVKFIFIDPKRVELGVYSRIPHLKTEVVVEPKKAANALRWAVAEMEKRYRLLAEVHVRSIDIYNKAVRDPKERKRLALRDSAADGDGDGPSAEDIQPLPYYVIIIDELADLMMVASSEVEASIARLAQMARAVGIHLIVATQRPSVDVLTGTIKANFPCRLSFATATRHDSRTILDQVGAEKLLGNGDALFMPPGTSRIRRIHGAYISEQETASLVRWLKRRGTPDLDPEVVKDQTPEVTSGADGPAEDDPLYDEAARVVVAEQQASASFLQRRMRVGFSRAARLVDMLEADGLLGPAQGSKPRDVLVPIDYFDEMESAKSAVED